ncbi:MAG: hypothetical protein Q8N13_16290 [Acidovorax sp.]|nr:hypothetical protein [Acidovorax sp.]
MMRSSPLRLKELVFPQISVKALVPKAPDQGTRDLPVEALDISFVYDLDADGGKVGAGIKVATTNVSHDAADESFLYRIQVEAFANFDVIGPEHQDALAVYLRKVAAASALIGAVREQIATTTARGPWGIVMLPIISMDKVIGMPPKRATSESGDPALGPPAKKAVKRKQIAV